MTFRDPELQEYMDRCQLRSISDIDPEILPVFHLMCCLGHFRYRDEEKWPSNGAERPQSQRIQEIVERLIAPELRIPLRKWYGQGIQMNASATIFREALERLTGEKFGS